MIDEKIVAEVMKVLKEDGYECFSSEAQLRDAFAIKLCKVYPECIVIPEYTKEVPVGWELNEKNNIFFDLLIKDKKNNERILFEFKYKTKKGDFIVHSDMEIRLSDQSDTTNGRYAFWRDIYRLEHFVNSNDIAKGFMIFVTNNKTYYSQVGKTCLDYSFSLEPGMHKAMSKAWNKTGHSINSIQKVYRGDVQPLQIKNDYFFDFREYSNIKDNKGKVHQFESLVVPIYSDDVVKELEDNLRKMGKGVFVQYYDYLKNDDTNTIKTAIGSEHTATSVATRVSNGVNIFKKNREIESLRIIIASSRVDENLRIKAQEILKREL